MRILLATPFITGHTHDTGVLVAKALNELGNPIYFWDFRITTMPPEVEYDLVVVIKGENIRPKQLKHPLVNWFPDNLIRYPNIEIESYDKFYTINKEDRGIFLPGACDPDVHKPMDVQQVFDVVFVGTANSPKKPAFLNQLVKKIRNITIFGNNWDLYGMHANPPQYFHDFARTISAAKIALNLHWDLYGIGTNRKVHEIAGVGKALLLTDKVKGLSETYPMAPCFTSVNECSELIQYYLDHDEERNKLVLEMQKRAYERFTYKRQMQRILEEL